MYCEGAPVMKISASFIRQAIKEGKDVRFLLTEPVHKYVEEMHFYNKKRRQNCLLLISILPFYSLINLMVSKPYL